MNHRTRQRAFPAERLAPVALACPICGNQQFRRIKCRSYCLQCNTLVENCNGD